MVSFHLTRLDLGIVEYRLVQGLVVCLATSSCGNCFQISVRLNRICELCAFDVVLFDVIRIGSLGYGLAILSLRILLRLLKASNGLILASGKCCPAPPDYATADAGVF